MRLMFVLILSIGFLFISLGLSLHAGEKFPDWVPEGAIEVAKEGIEEEFIPLLLTLVKEYREAGMSSEDFQGCELRHPYEIVLVDFQKYYERKNLQDIFERERGIKERIGFHVYCGGKHLGTIEAYLDSLEEWHYFSRSFTSYEGFFDGYDVYGELFEMFKAEEGYKICKIKLFNEYIVMKDKRIVYFTKYNISDRKWEYYDPVKYVTKPRKSIIIH